MHRRTSTLSSLVDGAKPRQVSVALPADTPPRDLLNRFLTSDASLVVLNQRQPKLVRGQHGRPSRKSLRDGRISAALDRSSCLDGRWRHHNGTFRRYSLNFYGRATVASVKNFQLVPGCGENSTERVCYQLGKVGQDSFNLDFAAPFTPFTALGLALSQFV